MQQVPASDLRLGAPAGGVHLPPVAVGPRREHSQAPAPAHRGAHNPAAVAGRVDVVDGEGEERGPVLHELQDVTRGDRIQGEGAGERDVVGGAREGQGIIVRGRVAGAEWGGGVV